VEPFVVEVPQADLDDLSDRLARTRWADDYANEGWTYGVERSWLQDMVTSPMRAGSSASK
jgi:hypothetical protein